MAKTSMSAVFRALLARGGVIVKPGAHNGLSARIIDAAAENLGVARDKVFVNVDRYGNTSSGSIPLALDEAFREGKIQPGSRIILSGFGGGLAWGTALLSW